MAEKEDVEKSFKFICESFRRNLNGNQIERLPAEVFKNNSGLAFLWVTSKHLMYYWFALDSIAICVELCHLLTLWEKIF